MKILKDNRKAQWDSITDLLTLKQYNQVSHDDRTYRALAIEAMRVSKSKKVHTLATKLVATCDALVKHVTHFQGLALPRTELIKTLINAHVVAVHEYDHAEAEDIEDYLFDLSHFAEKIDSITYSDVLALRASKASVQS